MIDVQCAKCKHRYGFQGEPLDQSLCPKCCNKPDPAKMAADAAEIAAFRKLLATRSKDADGSTIMKKREASGLFIHHAAIKLGIPWRQLEAIENGREKPSPELAEKMDKLYGDEG